MSEKELVTARAAFERVMAAPTPGSLWELHKALVVMAGEAATRARAVVRSFHSCLRGVESKSSSRAASRWGAALGTAAVASVSIREIADRQEDALHRLLQSWVPAILEIGAAAKSAQAWEVESQLIYDDLAWFLYDELWDVSTTARPDLSATERRDQIDLVLDARLPDSVRADLVISLFRNVLAARVIPLFGAPSNVTRG